MKPDEKDLVKKHKSEKSVKPSNDDGIYEEAGDLSKKEAMKPGETEGIYEEAKELGEKTKEKIDSFMSEPEKK